MHAAGLKSEPEWTKMSSPGATFAHFGHLVHSFAHFFNELFVDTSAFLRKFMKEPQKYSKLH